MNIEYSLSPSKSGHAEYVEGRPFELRAREKTREETKVNEKVVTAYLSHPEATSFFSSVKNMLKEFFKGKTVFKIHVKNNNGVHIPVYVTKASLEGIGMDKKEINDIAKGVKDAEKAIVDAWRKQKGTAMQSLAPGADRD